MLVPAVLFYFFGAGFCGVYAAALVVLLLRFRPPDIWSLGFWQPLFLVITALFASALIIFAGSCFRYQKWITALAAGVTGYFLNYFCALNLERFDIFPIAGIDWQRANRFQFHSGCSQYFGSNRLSAYDF